MANKEPQVCNGCGNIVCPNEKGGIHCHSECCAYEREISNEKIFNECFEAMEKENPSEQWRDIAGYEGRYQISDYGRVRSLAREVPAPKGREVQLLERIMKQCDQYRGYKVVYLYRENKKARHYVHRLVAFAFLIPPTSDVVNHKNLNKHDNSIWNLEWATFSANTQHYHDNKKKDEAF